MTGREEPAGGSTDSGAVPDSGSGAGGATAADPNSPNFDNPTGGASGAGGSSSDERDTGGADAGAPGGDGAGDDGNAGHSPDPSDQVPDAGETPECPAEPLEGGDHRGMLEIDGQTREYLLHVPPSYDGGAAVPLVIDLHAWLSDAEEQAARSGWSDKADEEGFAVVYPEGVANSWNAGGVCCGAAVVQGIDDVAFIRQLIEHLAAQVCLDHTRIYVTGYEAGGALAHRLGCEAADVIAAAAPVAFPITLQPMEACQPSQPVSIVQLVGAGEPAASLSMSVDDSVAHWSAVNACGAEPVAEGELCSAHPACEAGSEVTLCTLDAGRDAYDNADGVRVPDLVWPLLQR